MFPLFKDRSHQDHFERNGFVKLPLLTAGDVERLRAHYEEFSRHRQLANTPYGVVVSLDLEELQAKRQTIELIREIVLPRADRYLQNWSTHLGSFIVKLPDPESFTLPHQDWTFVDNDKIDDHFSFTMWIALGDYTRDQGSLGFVKGSHRFFPNINCSPRPAAATPTEGLELLLGSYVSFPELRAGDALAFNNETIHASLPNRSDEPRIAIGIGFRPADTVLHHYFLKPGTRDRLLKFIVGEDFYFHYGNESLQKLWESGGVPDYCNLVRELPYHLGRVSAEELEALCLSAGNTKNDDGFRYPVRAETARP